MQAVGFEPTPPERPRPERGALDHSATLAYSNINLIQIRPDHFQVLLDSKIQISSLAVYSAVKTNVKKNRQLVGGFAQALTNTLTYILTFITVYANNNFTTITGLKLVF